MIRLKPEHNDYHTMAMALVLAQEETDPEGFRAVIASAIDADPEHGLMMLLTALSESATLWVRTLCKQLEASPPVEEFLEFHCQYMMGQLTLDDPEPPAPKLRSV